MSIARKSHLGTPVDDQELEALLDQLAGHEVTEEELTEQRASFVFGNAPAKSEITRDSARHAAESVLI